MLAKASNEALPFIPADEVNDYKRRSPLCSTITTAIHELLGHGSGSMLAETEPGIFNFDVKNPPISPIDGRPVSSWYGIGQTWGSVFGGIAGSYEECRAECTVLWLAAERELLKMFGCGEVGSEGFDESKYLTGDRWEKKRDANEMLSDLYDVPGDDILWVDRA